MFNKTRTTEHGMHALRETKQEESKSTLYDKVYEILLSFKIQLVVCAYNYNS